MKFLILFFGFYILLLPCLPCTDTDECSGVSGTENLRPANHEKQDHENEICNPFCSCTCCGHVFSPGFQPGNSIEPKYLAAQQQQYFYKSIFLASDFFGNIWQPPKFS